MDIKKLLEMQADLDKEILKNAGIKEYPKDSIELALLVELGELANEVKSFKYWQKNKHIDRTKILEEFADCLHFALSLENHLIQMRRDILGKFAKYVNELKEASRELKNNIDDAFIETFCMVLQERSILIAVIVLGLCLDISLDEMEEAYIKKNKENYRRQAEGY